MYLFRKPKQKSSSRIQIQLHGVRDGVLLLPEQCYGQIMRVSSLNFELMSEAEQDALIDTFQSFLNSLNTPFQIIVRVREMDMDRYLESFRVNTARERQRIYRQQAEHYISFVKNMVQSNKILSRSFYLVVKLKSDEKDFDVIHSQLKLSIDMMRKGLSRMGIQLTELNSLEALDLFYSFYSPNKAKSQPLSQQTVKLLQGAVL